MTELEKHQAHRIECLEAKVRKYRQAARNLSEAVIAGKPEAETIAQEVKRLLKADEESMG